MAMEAETSLKVNAYGMTQVYQQTRREVIVPHNGQQHEKGEESGASSSAQLYFNPSDSLTYVQNGAAIGIAISATEGVQEIYLKRMFLMPPNHQFYCPSCQVSIDKVLFCTKRQETTAPAVPGPLGIGPNILQSPQIKPLQTPSIGPTIPQSPAIKDPVHTPPGIGPTVPQTPEEVPVRCSACFTLLVEKGKEFFTGLASHFAGQRTETAIPIPPQPEIITQGTSKGWEILKSIVYGGLAELLASLSVVTSAASADASTLSIVALAIANLIGGLFILAHNLRDLKASQPRQEASTETEAPTEDKYYELLGNRENFLLHAFVAILSFLIFGLVPPIIYGFAFRESDDKDLKLAVVAGASLICIALLAIAKAYTQRGSTYVTYIKTISFYVTSGVLASLLTYLAGTFMKRLVEQLGWFEPRSNLGFPNIAEMSMEKSGWGSY